MNMNEEKTCPTCGTRFTPRTYHHTYCSEACRKRAERRKKKGLPISDEEYEDYLGDRICPWCGVPFIPDQWNQKYCCEECAWSHRNQKRRYGDGETPFKECQWCGRKFQTFRRDKKYCSIKCRKAAASKRYNYRKKLRETASRKPLKWLCHEAWAMWITEWKYMLENVFTYLKTDNLLYDAIRKEKKRWQPLIIAVEKYWEAFNTLKQNQEHDSEEWMTWTWEEYRNFDKKWNLRFRHCTFKEKIPKRFEKL